MTETALEVPTWKEGDPSPIVGSIINIPLEYLRPTKNTRNDIDQEKLQGLATSIQKKGQRQEARVYIIEDGVKIRFAVIGGNRRWAACVLKKIPELRCKIVSVPNVKARFVDTAIDNGAREGYTTYDLIQIVREGRQEHGMDNTEISDMMGWTGTSYVSQLANMIKLHPSILERMRPTVPDSKRLTLTVGQPLSALSHEDQLGIIEKITGTGVSAARARSIIDATLAARGLVREGKDKRSPNKDFRVIANFSKGAKEKLSLLLEKGLTKYREMLENRSLGDVMHHLDDLEQEWNMLRMLHQRMCEAKGIHRVLEKAEVAISPTICIEEPVSPLAEKEAEKEEPPVLVVMSAPPPEESSPIEEKVLPKTSETIAHVQEVAPPVPKIADLKKPEPEVKPPVKLQKSTKPSVPDRPPNALVIRENGNGKKEEPRIKHHTTHKERVSQANRRSVGLPPKPSQLLPAKMPSILRAGNMTDAQLKDWQKRNRNLL